MAENIHKEFYKKGDRIIRVFLPMRGEAGTVIADEYIDEDGDLVIPTIFDNPKYSKWTEKHPYYSMHNSVQRLLESDILDFDED